MIGSPDSRAPITQSTPSISLSGSRMKESLRSGNMRALAPSKSCPDMGGNSDVVMNLSNEIGVFNCKPAESRTSFVVGKIKSSTLKSQPRAMLNRFSLQLCSDFQKLRGGTVDSLLNFSKLHWVDRGQLILKQWNVRARKTWNNNKGRKTEKLKRAVHTDVNEQDSKEDLSVVPPVVTELSDQNTMDDAYLSKLSCFHDSIGPKNVYPPPRGLDERFGLVKEVLLDVRGINPYGEEISKTVQKVSEEEEEREKSPSWNQLPLVWENHFKGKSGDLDYKRVLYRMFKERMTNPASSKKNTSPSKTLSWAAPELFMDEETSRWLGTQRQQSREWEIRVLKESHFRDKALLTERSLLTTLEFDWINALATSQLPLWHRYLNDSLAKRPSLAKRLDSKLHRLLALAMDWKVERLVRLWIFVEQLKSDARRSWITTLRLGKALVKRPIRQNPAEEVTNYDHIDCYSLPDVGGAADIYSFTNLNVLPLYNEEMLEKWIRLKKRVYKVKSIIKLTKSCVSEQLNGATTISKRQNRLAFHPVVSLGRFLRCTAINRDSALQASRQAMGDSNVNLEYATDDETTYEEENNEEVPEKIRFSATSRISKKSIYQGIHQRLLDDQIPDSRFEENKRRKEPFQISAPLGRIFRPFTSSSLIRSKIILKSRLSFGKTFQGRKAVARRPKLSPSNLSQSTFSCTATQQTSHTLIKTVGNQGLIAPCSSSGLLDQQKANKFYWSFDLRLGKFETDHFLINLPNAFREGISTKIAGNDSKDKVFKDILSVLKTVTNGMSLNQETKLESTMLSKGPNLIFRFRKQKHICPLLSLLVSKHQQMESSKIRNLSIPQPKDLFVDWMKSSLSPTNHRRERFKHMRGKRFKEQDLVQREHLCLPHQKSSVVQVFPHPYKENRSDNLKYSMATKISRFFHKRRPTAFEINQWLIITSILGPEDSLISLLFYYEMSLLGRLQTTQKSSVSDSTPVNFETHSYVGKKYSIYSKPGKKCHCVFGLVKLSEGLSSLSFTDHYQEQLKLRDIHEDELYFKILPREYQFDLPNKPRRKSSILPPRIMQLPNETHKKITLFGRVVSAYTVEEVRALSLSLEFMPYPRIPKPQLEHHKWSQIEIDVPGDEKRLYFKPPTVCVPSPKPISQRICDHARLDDAVKQLFIRNESHAESDDRDEYQNGCLDESTSHSTSLKLADNSKKLSTGKKSWQDSRWRLMKEAPYHVAEGYFKSIFVNMKNCNFEENVAMITSNVLPERVRLVHLDFDEHSNTVKHKTKTRLSEGLHTKHVASIDFPGNASIPQYLVDALGPFKAWETPKQRFCPDYTIHQKPELSGLKRVSDFNRRSQEAMRSFVEDYPDLESEEEEESLLVHEISMPFSLFPRGSH